MAGDAMIREVRPSLDRLKALDSLPDLESQLQEARQLCNRPARAEMVSKWLLERLKSNQESSGNVEVWETLLSAFRLIPPHQLASILTSHNFFTLCRPNIDESRTNSEEQPISVISRILNLLIEISQGPEATHMKAVLSLSAPEAAPFLGTWLDAALTFYDVVEYTRPTYNLLSAGIDLWNLRKPSSDENELFAKHCLLPITKLLHVVLEYEENYEEYCGGPEDEEYEGFEFQRKTRSAGSDTPRPGHKYFLESMLARHVFVPARTSFFKSRDAAETGGRRQVGSQDPTFTLRSMFSTLREGLRLDDDDDGQSQLSRLLDIAVRCISMSSPKHRIRDRPWIDAVFEALFECLKASSGDENLLDALADMLSIIKKKGASLSRQILDRLIKRHSNLDSGEQVNWKIISLVIELDNDVFVDDDKAITLMTEITHASVDKAKESARLTDPQVTSSGRSQFEQHLADSLRKGIATPLMKAFAERRKLEDFIHMWAAQISYTEIKKILPVWGDLAIDLVPLVEASLTPSQIVGIFDRYSTVIETAAKNQIAGEDALSQSTLNASVVILDAILSGVQSETVADSLHTRYGTLFSLMLGMEQEQSVPRFFPMEPQSWSLMARVFDLWFPKWTAQQSDQDTVTATAMDILESSGFRLARFHESAGNVCDAASAFVACICSRLRQYDARCSHYPNAKEAPRILCTDAINSIRTHSNEARWSILLRYPDLIADFDVNNTLTMIEECICSGSEASTKASQALMLQASLHEDSTRIDVLVHMLVRFILHDQPDGDKASYAKLIGWTSRARELKALKALAGLSPSSIPRSHRETLIHAICSQQLADESPAFGQNVQSWRFAILDSLFKLPNPTSSLATDPEMIWQLAKSIKMSNMDTDLPPTLEPLTVQLSTHLLATQDQERSRSMLIKLSEKIKGFIEVVPTDDFLDIGSENSLIVMRMFMQQMESTAKGDLKSKLAYRTQNTMKLFVDARIQLIDRTLQQVILMEDSISIPVKTLLAIPQSLIELSGVDVASTVVPLMETAMSQLMDLHIRNWETEERELQRISVRNGNLVECFSLACSVSPHGYIPTDTNWALEISKLHLTPDQRNSFLTTFGSNVERLQSQQYADLLNDLLDLIHAGEDELCATTLPLVEICAAKLDKIKLNDADIGMPMLLSILLARAKETSNMTVRRRALASVATTLKGNSCLLTQYCVEVTLTGLKKILDDPSKAQSAYMDVCRILSAVLLQYRSRLHGRFHLIVPVFQALLSRLFQPNALTGANDQRRSLTTKHAQAVSKLLKLFCEPRSKRSSKLLALVDEARKEQAYVGRSVQYVLHHWCTQMLNGKLETGVREAITPGLWSIIEAMEMGPEAEGVKSLSATMNNSERAILRGIYDDWRRFGKWRGA